MRSLKKVLLLIETSRSFGRQLIQGISQFVFEHRTWNIIFQDRSMHERFPEWLRNWDGDGVISRSNDPVVYRTFKRRRIPMVDLLGDGKKRVQLVQCDEPHSGRMVADHFWERGFRSFGFFSMGSNWWSLDRLRAFQEGLTEYDAKCEISPTCEVENDVALSVLWWKGCEDEIHRWVDALPKPVGIFCPWDMQAFFLMNVCESRGIQIPEDVAVVGYGNNADFCRVSTPPLSSVAPNAREIGYRAAFLLDKMITGEPLPEFPIFVPATHIETRQSSDTIAVQDPVVSSAVAFIRKNIDRDAFGVPDISRHLNVSTSTLMRKFRKWLGHSPQEEILRARIAFAQEMLRETDFSVEMIAAKLGYSNGTNFVRAFRRITLTTPEEYRRLNRSH